MKVNRRTVTLLVLLALSIPLLILVVRAKNQSQQPPKEITDQTVQNLGPGFGNPLKPTGSANAANISKPMQAEVRFYDINRLPTSEAALTTEACAVHGSAELPGTASPIYRSSRLRRPNTRPTTKDGWMFLCSRATDEQKWRVHPNPVKLVMSSDGPTPFELVSPDIRMGRPTGTTLILQCIVCSKKETVGEVVSPDAMGSIMGASEVRSLKLNAPMGPSAVIETVNNVPVESTQFISSPRLAIIRARVRNVPAGARAYLVSQPFDQSERWISLLQPQNTMAGDRFIGTAVLGKASPLAKDNYQKFWVSVVISYQPFRVGIVDKNGEQIGIPIAEWDARYGPTIQAVSQEPVVVRRIPHTDVAGITLNIDGAATGYGNLNGAPIPVTKHVSVYGQIDVPATTEDMTNYRVWLLVYPEADFDGVVSGTVKSTTLHQEARLVNAEWNLPWATLPNPGRYIVIAVLADNSKDPPIYITDGSVLAVSQPQLVEWKVRAQK